MCVNLLHPRPEQISKTLRNWERSNLSALPSLPFRLQSCDGTQPVLLTYLLSARCICAKRILKEIALQGQLPSLNLRASSLPGHMN